MEYAYKILGEIRSSDQIIRLNLAEEDRKYLANQKENLIPEIYPGRGTYIHEWSHYIQFNITPIGIIISKLRRELFTSLCELTGGLGNASMPMFQFVNRDKSTMDKFRAHENVFEVLEHVWQGWPENWMGKPENASAIISKVTLSLSGLVVTLEGSKQTYQYPIGISQVFEAWAWIEENIHSNMFLDFTMDYSLKNLIYTWPVHVLIGVIGNDEFEKNKVAVCGDLIGLLIAASYYDPFAWQYEPLCKSHIGQELIKNNRINTQRIVFQIFRNIKDLVLYGREKKLEDAFNDFTRKSNLPDLKSCIIELKSAVSELIRDENKDLEKKLKELDTENFVYHEPYKTGLAILTASEKNVQVFIDNFEAVLTDPFVNMGQFELPMVAEFNGLYYDWKIIKDLYAEENEYDFGKVYQKYAGYTFFEHIVYQLLFSEHLACYDSVLWKYPIEKCEHMASCVQLKAKKGIAFCKNVEWKGIVSFYINALAGTYGNEKLADNIVGLDVVLAEVQANILSREEYYKEIFEKYKF